MYARFYIYEVCKVHDKSAILAKLKSYIKIIEWYLGLLLHYFNIFNSKYKLL